MRNIDCILRVHTPEPVVRSFRALKGYVPSENHLTKTTILRCSAAEVVDVPGPYRHVCRYGRRAAGVPPGGFLVFRFLLLVVFLAVLPLFAFPACATVSQIDRQPFAIASMPEKVVPLWRSFPGGCESVDCAVFCLAFFSGTVTNPRLTFHALRMYLLSPSMRIVVAGGKAGSTDTPGGEVLSTRVSSFVRDNDLLVGINVLPFAPVSGREGEPRTNVGIVIADGRMLSPPHPNFDALVFFDDGSVAIKPQTGIGSAQNVANAVGGFRRILEGYEPVPRVLGLQPRHPRSAAGISSCGRFLYLLVVDGRRPASVGSTEAETALLLRALGAAEGINFDGGGSTALAMRFPGGEVRVVNTPVHGQIPGRERAVAGSLGIKMCGRNLNRPEG